ncbi:MAG: ParA family protein [Myxococcota bacterium]
MSTDNAVCSVCGAGFTLQFVYQMLATPQGRYHLCSEACRKQLLARSAPPPPVVPPVRMAVLNQKGGVGKTTTAVNLAAGLADKGFRTLLVDADAQGSVGVSLGVRGGKSLYHVLLEGAAPAQASVPVRNNLDVLTADETLAQAEIKLAQHPKRASLLTQRLAAFTGYRFVILDCAPSLSLLNQNALCFADQVLVPVACDYLSLVGVKQILKTINGVRTQLGHPLELGAVLPTMFDGRAKVAQEALKALRDHFKDRALAPIRSCVKLKECPQVKRTIFEYAPDSTGAKDYALVVDWAMSLSTRQPGAPQEKPAPVELPAITTPAQTAVPAAPLMAPLEAPPSSWPGTDPARP